MAQGRKGKLNYRCPRCLMREIDMDMLYDNPTYETGPELSAKPSEIWRRREAERLPLCGNVCRVHERLARVLRDDAGQARELVQRHRVRIDSRSNSTTAIHASTTLQISRITAIPVST